MSQRYWIYRNDKLVGGHELNDQQKARLEMAGYTCVEVSGEISA